MSTDIAFGALLGETLKAVGGLEVGSDARAMMEPSVFGIPE